MTQPKHHHSAGSRSRTAHSASTYSPAALKAELNQKGYRLTPQREEILRTFQDLDPGEHLSAEDLHDILSQKDSDVSVSTIYRTLKVLAQMGVLRELELAEEHKHYELNLPETHHHHLLCVRCAKTVEFTSSNVLKVGSEIAKKEGFTLLDCQLLVHAVCPSCQRAIT